MGRARCSWRQACLASQEFFNAHSDPTAFTQAIYQNILFRPASAQDVTNVTSQPLTNAATRASIVDSLLSSQEALTADAQFDYQAILGRVGDTGGVSAVASELQRGTSFVNIALAFFNYPEYQLKAKTFVG